ncbi:MAG: L-threonylcarbamoyladenylate synthase [Pseudomonadota bacterium]|jgi:tRNA threonylcarbamoyl adenosine modification protein (Sua5/YciO/YrdC/YwlC family)|nr:threonylcarbamoyl-AMP synthase [Betaproteobacteria bacterium]
MSQYFTLHPDNPQPRLIKQAVAILRDGGVMAFPTDSSYALGCHLGDKSAQDRIRAIREVDDKHHFTLMCRDLSEISRYAQVNNVQFRLLKANTPGSYTFILEATREVPKRLQHPKRNTIGLRVPLHPITLALLEELGEPILSMTLILPGDELPMHEAEDIRERLEKRLELIVDAGACGVEPTTVIDLTHAEPVLIRVGLGALQPFGLN